MRCHRVRDNIKAYIDGELGPVERTVVRRHLSSCAECRAEANLMSELSRNIRESDAVTTPRGLRAKVMQGITFTPAQVSSFKRNRAWVSAAGLSLAAMVAIAVVLPKAQKSVKPGAKLARLAKPEAKSAVDGSGYDAESARDNENSVWASNSSGCTRPVIMSLPAASLSLSAGSTTGTIASSSATQSLSTFDFSGAKPMVIQTGGLTVKVKNFSKAFDEAMSICKSTGGFVSDSSSQLTENRKTSGNLTLRIPVEDFESTIARVSSLGVVEARQLKGEDVTTEVIDLDSRIRNLRSEEQQYLEVMKKAKSVEDIMMVRDQLSSVRGEIEQALGRMKYLKSSVSMATINLSLREEPLPKSAKQSTLGRMSSGATTSLKKTLLRITESLVWLGVYSPFWALPLGAAIYLRRRRSNGTDE